MLRSQRNAQWLQWFNDSRAGDCLPKMIRLLCLRHHWRAQDGEDAWSYAQVESLTHIDKFTGKTAAEFRNWLFGMARNYLLKMSERPNCRGGYWKVGARRYADYRMANQAARPLNVTPEWVETVWDLQVETFADLLADAPLVNAHRTEVNDADELDVLASLLETGSLVSAAPAVDGPTRENRSLVSLDRMPATHPRRRPYYITIKPDAAVPTSARGRILYELLQGVGKPLHTRKLRPIFEGLLKSADMSPQFKWTEFPLLATQETPA